MVIGYMLQLKCTRRLKRFVSSLISAIPWPLSSELSITVAKCIQLLLNTSRTSFKHIDNTVFIIDNRDKVIGFMDTSNATGETRKCISTWDFSTLYNQIPNDKLVKWQRLKRNCFNTNPGKHYISLSDKGRSAHWSGSVSKTNISFSCDELINSIDFIVNNSFITFHSLVYRQVIGIPMQWEQIVLHF